MSEPEPDQNFEQIIADYVYDRLCEYEAFRGHPAQNTMRGEFADEVGSFADYHRGLYEQDKYDNENCPICRGVGGGYWRSENWESCPNHATSIINKEEK